MESQPQKFFLEFNSISKKFPGVQALSAVSFGISEGTVHGLMGENGAGKSTLIKILSGYYQPDEGSIYIAGKLYKFKNPFQAIDFGINVIHQELQLIPHQTVAENLSLGSYESTNGFLNWKKLFQLTRTFLDSLGMDIAETIKVSELTIGQRQLVEIAKAIKHNAKILAFDEPTSSLSKLETDLLFKLIKRLKTQGKVILYISHRMAEIFEICDTCTILKDGMHVSTRKLNHQITTEDIIKAMTGRDIQNIYGYQKRQQGTTILQVKNLTGRGITKPCSLNIAGGEIVGLFGLVGAGRSELAKIIYGAEPTYAGTVQVDGNIILKRTVTESIKNGLMFCTEDRKKEGIINNRDVLENINISSRRHFSFFGTLLNLTRENLNAQQQVHALQIKTPSLTQAIENLSGGNQQKVILGRWLSEIGMKVLIIDEPTRGIDVGAKTEIYSILYQLAKNGVAILMISSELPEIIGVCDRLYIMQEGEISQELERSNFNEITILTHAFPKGHKGGQYAK